MTLIAFRGARDNMSGVKRGTKRKRDEPKVKRIREIRESEGSEEENEEMQKLIKSIGKIKLE